MDQLFRRLFGDRVMDEIQRRSYGTTGPVEPEIQDGWIRPESRGLRTEQFECDECNGDGCTTCDGRGWFRHFHQG